MLPLEHLRCVSGEDVLDEVVGCAKIVGGSQHLCKLFRGKAVAECRFAHGPSTGLVPAETVRVGQRAQDASTSGTGLAQLITQLLRIHAGAKTATADVSIAGLEAAQAENSVALLVHKLYFAILTTQIKLAASEEFIKAGGVHEGETMLSVAEGRSLDLAKLEAHAALLEEKHAGLTYALAIDDLTTQLDDVLGLALGTRLDLNAEILGDLAVLPSKEDAMATLFQAVQYHDNIDKYRTDLNNGADPVEPLVTQAFAVGGLATLPAGDQVLRFQVERAKMQLLIQSTQDFLTGFSSVLAKESAFFTESKCAPDAASRFATLKTNVDMLRPGFARGNWSFSSQQRMVL